MKSIGEGHVTVKDESCSDWSRDTSNKNGHQLEEF